MGERCNDTSRLRTHDCVDCSSHAKEPDLPKIVLYASAKAPQIGLASDLPKIGLDLHSSEDRKIAQEACVRTQRSFKFGLGRSPTPLLLPLICR